MDFIFQDILCHYGAVAELVTDNGYNSKANGPVEQKHWDFWQVMFKVVDGDASHWPKGFYSALWSEHITTTRTLGCSPYFAAHGVHPVLPFDIDEATYLVPPPDSVLSDEDLLAHHGKEFAK